MDRALDAGRILNRQRPQDLAPSNAYETIMLAVDGMHCGGCMRKVEAALSATPGVQTARANLTSHRAYITTKDKNLGADRLIEVLEHSGFKAAHISEPDGGIHEGRDHDLLRRLGVAGFAAMNIMLLSVSVWAGASADMDRSIQTLFHWLSALIALPAVAYAGQPFFVSAGKALAMRRLNMDVPISLGVILATAMSLYQTMRGSEQVYFDAAVTLLAFLLAGRMLDEQMRKRASSAATNLLGLKSSAATVVENDGRVTRLPLELIEPGMTVTASAGERIPVDGILAAGESEIDQSLITGESLPRRVCPGDQVFAGTINLAQPIQISVTKREENALLAEIAQLMATAEQGRGRYVRLADRAAKLYAPAVHILGFATFTGWLLAGHVWQDALTAAIAVLIVTCPCAIALAVPAVQVAAASRLFSKGIILKSADGLERLAEIDTVVFDKTGTLTLGEPVLINTGEIEPAMLQAAAALASASRHPYSRAIVKAAGLVGITSRAAGACIETPGFGLLRQTPLGEQRLGSAQWCGVRGREPAAGEIWFKQEDGRTACFKMRDSLRTDSADVAAELIHAGYRTAILSGDSKASVSAAAKDARIDAWLAGQHPGQKIAFLEKLKNSGHKVLMAGDGLNDAPALAAAHASISPSSAADISQTASDAIFQGERLSPIIEILAVAKAAKRMSLQNFGLAVAYNVVFVPLAMAGLVTPLIAAIAMSASSISVIANAVRLKSKALELKA